MKIYLAARFGRRLEIQGYRAQLESAGHIVNGKWLDEPLDLAVGAPLEGGVRFALDDFGDLTSSECIVSFTEAPGKPTGGRGRGGRHVEFGMALGMNAVLESRGLRPIRVIVVGWRENVFHYLPAVEFYETWAEAFVAINADQRIVDLMYL